MSSKNKWKKTFFWNKISCPDNSLKPFAFSILFHMLYLQKTEPYISYYPLKCHFLYTENVISSPTTVFSHELMKYLELVEEASLIKGRSCTTNF